MESKQNPISLIYQDYPIGPLGIAADGDAIANMITNGESKIVKLACVFYDGKVGFPCGACREFLMQLSPESPKMEILVNYETRETVTLGDLCPNWWGTDQMAAEIKENNKKC